MKSGTHLRRLGTADLTRDEIREIRSLLQRAFAGDEHGGFDEDDWQHALGGVHFVLKIDGQIVSHAAVVQRELHIAGRAVATGYVEAVATAPDQQGMGHGTTVMRAVNDHIEEQFELGALGTGSHGFYERLGWQTWQGPSSVRVAGGEQQPTPDEDGYIMVLLTSRTGELDLTAPISCEWRPGDVW
jgi:aminoglycoside 2'-N-acetyltransferase I